MQLRRWSLRALTLREIDESYGEDTCFEPYPFSQRGMYDWILYIQMLQIPSARGREDWCEFAPDLNSKSVDLGFSTFHECAFCLLMILRLLSLCFINNIHKEKWRSHGQIPDVMMM